MRDSEYFEKLINNMLNEGYEYIENNRNLGYMLVFREVYIYIRTGQHHLDDCIDTPSININCVCEITKMSKTLEETLYKLIQSIRKKEQRKNSEQYNIREKMLDELIK